MDKDKKIIKNIKSIIENIDPNPNRISIKDTPVRVMKMYKEIFSGYSLTPKKVKKSFNSNGYKGIVTIKDISFYSVCEHHMIPFFGKVHIGYMPNGNILGLSKFARFVDIYSKRLQTQENLTKQIAEAIKEETRTEGCMVVVEARHLCMEMRGVNKPGATTRTSVKTGTFLTDDKLLNEFYNMIDFNKQSKDL